jgi:hypothetical protein
MSSVFTRPRAGDHALVWDIGTNRWGAAIVEDVDASSATFAFWTPWVAENWNRDTVVTVPRSRWRQMVRRCDVRA